MTDQTIANACVECGNGELYEAAYGHDGEVVLRRDWVRDRAYVISPEHGFYGEDWPDGAIGVLPSKLPPLRDVWVTRNGSYMRWDGEPEWLMFCSTCHQEQPTGLRMRPL